MELVQPADAHAQGPRGLRHWAERRRLRTAADASIEGGDENGASSLYGWRVAELTSRHERLILGSSVREIVAELSSGRLPGAAPLNRVALRPYRAELNALADRLDDLERPVSARGMLAVRRLLTEPGSVLYHRPTIEEEPRDIGCELVAVLDRLEARP